MFLSRRVVPQTPPSLVKLSSRARGVMTGAGTSVPSRDHVPELRKAARRLGGDGGDGGAGVVAGGRDYGRSVEAAEDRAGFEDLRAAGARAGRGRRRVPVAHERVRGVHELRRGGVGVFGAEVAGEPVIEEVGDGDERVGGIEQARRLARGGEDLIERVDRHELDAGEGVDLFARDDAADGFDHAIGAVVAVMIGVFEKLALFADERVIDSPGVEGYAGEVFDGRVVEGLFDLGPEAEDVPAQRARS